MENVNDFEDFVECINTVINYISLKYEMLGKNVNDFYNGKCYYFCKILKEIFNFGTICLLDGHYIFMYKNYFFDFTGVLYHDNEFIYFLNEKHKMSNLIFCNDNEYIYADISSAIDEVKDKDYLTYADELIELGKNIFKTSSNYTLTKKKLY